MGVDTLEWPEYLVLLLIKIEELDADTIAEICKDMD